MTTSQELLGGDLADVRDAVHEAAHAASPSVTGAPTSSTACTAGSSPRRCGRRWGSRACSGSASPRTTAAAAAASSRSPPRWKHYRRRACPWRPSSSLRSRARRSFATATRSKDAVRRADGNRRVAHGVRDHRAQRGNELVADRDHRAASGRRQLPAQRPEGLHLGGRLVRAHDGRVPQHEAVGRRDRPRAWRSS